MTPKEKAEKYAEGYRCPATNKNEYCKHDIISAYNNGYTQCQEDIVEKYTEQDMIKFAFDTYYQEDMAKKYTKEDIINIVKKSRETGLTAEYLILQLNKQDK
jgi:hypothetical protein